MPSPPKPTNKQRQHERAAAKARVVRAYKDGENWREVAAHNDVPYSTARRAVLDADSEPKTHGGRVKMTVKVLGKLEEYLDEDCRHTCEQMRDRLRSDLSVSVSTSSVHRALQGMIYSLKHLCTEKITMNKTENKNKRKEFVEELEKHASRGDMIVFQDETNFNMYLSRNEGYSRVGERATIALTSSQGSNLHVQGGVSSGTDIVLMRTHSGSETKQENARFVADLFTAALGTDEYCELAPSNKIVIVTDNAPAHSQVETLEREMLVEDGILNRNMLVVLRLAPYSPMLNPIEGCWNVLKAKMRLFIAERKEEFLVRGEYDTFCAHCHALMEEAVEMTKPVITRRLVWRMERNCLKASFAAGSTPDR
ncbi:Transposase [Phytophthora megakarya]|uniref:Transposase n=1 Tax=Phytophthora megakarya TaxID=4795 RepID=A0A225VKX0_9STRA|nr:Transposase [Phytophthora megakarya]